jgi:hypothetical protein
MDECIVSLEAVVKLNLWKEGSEFVKRVSFLKIETTSDAQQIIELSVVVYKSLFT